MNADIVIIGGGPGGLSAALTAGRSLKRTVLFDSGPRRNARAHAINTFVTRDGIVPQQFRDIGREQLAKYDTVEVRDTRVERIEGSIETGFQVGDVHARRVLIVTGMIDVLPPIEGLDRLWGDTVFTCPFCHGFENRNRRWAALIEQEMFLPFPKMLSGWTDRLVTLSNGTLTGPGIDARKIIRLEGEKGLERIVFEVGAPLEVDVLVMRPPQVHVPLVQSLGLELDPMGFVKVDPMLFQTSRPGIHAAGDVTTMRQGAIGAASDGMLAAAGMVHSLNVGGVH